jgi:hypothetical protein
VWLTCIGVTGTAATGLVGKAAGLGIPLGGACLTLAVLALIPMTYQARAAACVALAGSALFVVHWGLQGADQSGAVMLPVGVLSLATALLFRSWHRASSLARLLVALGIALCIGWLWTTQILAALLTIEGAWQTWLPPLLATPLPLLLLLSMLAFMDARSTGGSRAWASLLLAWYALVSWSALLPLGWPVGAGGFELERVPEPLALGRLLAPLLAIAVSLGLAQLLAFARAGQRPT